MKNPLLPLVTVLYLSAPALAGAQALQCPEPAPVFAQVGANTLDLGQLAQTVGNAQPNSQALYTVAEQIHADYPDATNPEVADIMITAFCTYLNTDAPADRRSDASVRAFEQETYAAVFGGPPPRDYPMHGWLYSN